MEKAKNKKSNYLRGTYNLIAHKFGCHPKYVSRVLNNRLGKYEDRDTELVKRIREEAAIIEEMFKPG
jgi:hypothetical protein